MQELWEPTGDARTGLLAIGKNGNYPKKGGGTWFQITSQFNTSTAEPIRKFTVQYMLYSLGFCSF